MQTLAVLMTLLAAAAALPLISYEQVSAGDILALRVLDAYTAYTTYAPGAAPCHILALAGFCTQAVLGLALAALFVDAYLLDRRARLAPQARLGGGDKVRRQAFHFPLSSVTRTPSIIAGATISPSIDVGGAVYGRAWSRSSGRTGALSDQASSPAAASLDPIVFAQRGSGSSIQATPSTCKDSSPKHAAPIADADVHDVESHRPGEDSVFGPYILLDILGTGSFGRVMRGRHVASGEEVAVKLIPRTHVAAEQAFIENEVGIMKVRTLDGFS